VTGDQPTGPEPPPGPARDLADAFRGLRHTKPLSVSQLARKTGLSASHVSEVLQGKKAPSQAAAENIARALGADVRTVQQIGRVAAELIELNRHNRRQRTHPARPGRLLTAPPLSGAEIARPRLIQAVTDLVLASGAETVAMTAGVRGAGGFGKTTVARMMVQREDVRRHFAAGILWVTVGEEVRGPELAEKLNQLCWQLTGVKPPLTDALLAGAELGRILGDKRVLLVVDDVWSAGQLAPFHGGSRTVRLVTTRQHSILPTGTATVDVDAMRPDEARDLLCYGLPPVSYALATGLLAATARWPVLLALVNRSARDRISRGQPAPEALGAILARIRRYGPTVLDVADPGQRHRAVAVTVEISIDQLDQADRDRYLELAVLPEDVEIPIPVLERYWHATGPRATLDAERLCERLADLSLANLRLDPPRLRLHDVIRNYLRHRAAGSITGLHRRLLNAHRGMVPPEGDATAWWRMPGEHGYLWAWLAHHLHAAGLTDELTACLHHPDYLTGKLEVLGPAALEADLLLLADPVTADLREMIRQNAHLFGPLGPPGALRATVSSRLRDRPGLADLAARFRGTLTPPSLEPAATLPDAAHPALSRLLLGDTSGVLTVTVAADASWVAAGSGSGTVHIWDPATGHLEHRLVGHDGAILALAGTGDAATLASAGHDGTVRVWDLVGGQCRHILTGHPGEVNMLAMLPGGRLASADSGGTVRIWDLQAGSCLHVLGGPAGEVTALAAAPDGSWLASAGQDHAIRVWDLQAGSCLSVLSGHAGEVTALAAAPDGSWLASASQDQTVRVWQVHPGCSRHVLTGHADRVWKLAVSPDGAWLASAGHDATVRIWDVASGAPRHTLTGHEGSIHALAIAPDRSWLASGDEAGIIRLWDPADGRCRGVFTGHTSLVMSFAVEPASTWLVSGGIDGTVRIWRSSCEAARPVMASHVKWINAVAAAPDGSWLATAGDDGTVRIWDRAGGQCRHILSGHSDAVRALAVSPDGAWLASAGYDGAVILWDPVRGRRDRTLAGATQRLRALTVSPQGRWLAAAGQEGTIWIWDPASGQCRQVLTGHPPAERNFGGVLATATDASGSWLASAGHDGMVRVWDLSDGQSRHLLTGHDGAVHALAIAPDASWLASGGQDRTVRLWDPVSGACLDTLHGHPGGVKALAAATDGSWVASADETGWIYVWDPASGRGQPVRAHCEWVWALAVSRDGWVASVGDDATVSIWDPASGECVTALRVDSRLRAVTWAGSAVVAAGAHGPYFLTFDPGP
jgi:WD40 repeat protein/transcriptional regulator with XRE-family HTH domain